MKKKVKLLLDSNYTVKYISNLLDDKEQNLKMDNVVCTTTFIALGEIFAYIYKNPDRWPQDKILEAQAEFANITVLRYHHDVTKYYGMIYKENKHKEQGKADTLKNDAWILAFARLYGMKIVTTNRKDFPDADLFDLNEFTYIASTSSLF